MDTNHITLPNDKIKLVILKLFCNSILILIQTLLNLISDIS